jgi:hypothetical protein
MKARKYPSVTSPERQRRASSSRRWRSGLVGLLFILPATAQAQSELHKPYDLTIVVHVAENRLLTDVFRKRIERELHDGFQAALGDMGRVTVTDKHPRLADILTRGLRSLDDWKDRNDQKTHFVLIDYTGVHYEIQARQYDGTIGLPGRVVRYDRTRDRDFVAKAAALLIKYDFGILGTVVSEPEGAKNQVKIELHGGGLGDMTRWIKKDDVFALAPPEGGTPLELMFSLLQVEQAPAEDARDGVCLCRFFHRYRVRSIAGYRCIKLGTVETPLRIRWVQRQRVRDGGFKIKPLDQPLLVEIRRHGFDGEEATKLEKQSEPNGALETVANGKDGVFRNVAFVRVISGLGDSPDSHPQVPIALVDDQPVVIDVNVSSGSADSLFAIRTSTWKRDVADSVQMQAGLFKRLETLGADPKNRSEIIKAAASGMNRAKEDRKNLREQREKLANEARKANQDLKTPTEDRRLQQLEDYEQALGNFLTEQKKIEETENDPQRKKWLSEIENAKLLENELEYGKAILIYERIQNEGFKDAELDKHVADLHKDWDPRNPEHEEARGFIYRVWPTLDSARLEENENIKKAQDALQTCKKLRDRLGIRKLLRGTLGHADQLEKKLAELRPDLVIEDAKEEQQLKPVSEKIAKLGTDIEDCLKALNNQ